MNSTDKSTSKVKFDESKNVVTEFAKNEKIKGGLRIDKPAQGKEVSSTDASDFHSEVQEEKKKEAAKPKKASVNVEGLKTSSAVIQARNSIIEANKGGPTSFYQFERDMKSLA
mmetsp:Transcript_35817/g.54890  ORF Transcript_35817/g.54890 Transcript_35817/m.54890 type:complete len:113 (+) Transcript_35817:1433-1771(+)